jgi:hypothetical protein
MGNYSGRPSLTSDKKVNSSVRPFLTSDKELIKKFFLLYIGNLYQTKEKSNNKTNRTQKNNNKSKKNKHKNTTFEYKYKYYIQTISKIYKTTPEDSLFAKLYKTTIDYRDLVAKINTAQDFYYVNTHGSFTGNMEPKEIPAQTVLIFLTPVNRLGITCNLSELSLIKDSFKNKDNRLFIQQNLPCLDKFNNTNNTNKVNTTNMTNDYKMFKNALILYPGQYYYDLKLSFTKKDTGKNMNVNYFTGDSASQDLIIEDMYDDILSEIVDGNFDEGKYNVSLFNSNNDIRYIIVDCCRNIDHPITHEKKQHFVELGKNIYIYENFMFYYNLIMANCNSIKINTFLPDIKFSSYNGLISSAGLNKRKLFDIYGSYMNDNFLKHMKESKESKEIENIVKLLKPLFHPDLDIYALKNYIYKLSLKYENDDIVIDTSIMLDALSKYYKKEKPPFLKYVGLIINLNRIENYLLHMLKDKIINKNGIETLRDIFHIVDRELGAIFDHKDEDYIKFKTQYSWPYLKAITECLEKIDTQTEGINLETDCKELNKLIESTLTKDIKEEYNDKFKGMEEKYKNMLSQLEKLLDTFLKKPYTIFPRILAETKSRGHSSLGNQGRRTLMNINTYKKYKNTTLSPKIEELIARESNAVISQLNLQGLDNASNA